MHIWTSAVCAAVGVLVVASTGAAPAVPSETSVKDCFTRAPAGDYLSALDAFAADTAGSWSMYCNSASLSSLYV